MQTSKKGLPAKWFRRISAGAVGVVMLNASHSLALQVGVDESLTIDIIAVGCSFAMGIAWLWLPVISDKHKDVDHGKSKTRTIHETP